MFHSLLIFLLSLSITLPASAIENIDDSARDEKGWTVWDTLGRPNTATVASDPAACTGGNITFVFIKGSDNRTWYRKRNLPTGIWTPWKILPKMMNGNTEVKATGGAAAYCINNPGLTTVIVQIVGDDGRIWSNYGWGTATNESFGAWGQTVGFNAAPYYRPALAGWHANPIYYFVRGQDARIYSKYTFNSTTTPYQVQANGPSYNSPAAVMPSSDRVDFFYRDQFGNTWQQFKIGTLWYSPQQITGVTYSSPAVVSRDIYTLDLFTRGPNGTIQQKQSVNGVWGNWINLGGSVASGGAGATTYASGARMFVFARWTDGTLRYKAWAP